jgi:hypothetical protein
VASLTVREAASSSEEQGQAVSALLALALHQGRLSHVLSAVETMLNLDAAANTEATPRTRVRSKKRKKGAGTDDDEDREAVVAAIALDVEPFLQQLAEHKRATHVPSAGSQSFVGSWQHSAPTLLSKAHADAPKLRDKRDAYRMLKREPPEKAGEVAGPCSVAGDGRFLFLLGHCGLLKVRTVV